MRMRDRRATLAIPVLGVAYFALVAWGAAMLGHVLIARPWPVPDATMRWVLLANAELLGWRLVMRMAFTGAAYGPVQAMLAIPRLFVANLIALLAARRALTLYWPTLRGQQPRWEKTAHHFPDRIKGDIP
jgi:adsorption protein B